MQVNITVGKPNNNVYFRCHADPAMSFDASVIIGANGSDDYYFVTPYMLNHHVILPRLRKVTIAVVYSWPGGAISLWPVPIVEETRIACWKSARAAYELSQTQWVQMIWNADTRDYDVATAEGITHRTVVAGRSRSRQSPEAWFRRTRSSAHRSIPMSCSYAGLPTSFDRFRDIWQCRF